MRGLIIDFGGVLSTPFDDSMRAFCKKEGLEPTALRTAILANAALLERLERGDATQAEFADTIGLALRVFPDDLVERISAAMELREDVMAAVKKARRKAKIAVLSNSLGSEPFDVYERFGLPHKVDVLIASDRVKMRKPEPAIYALAAERLGIPPTECVYADDSAKFLEPAGALGMTTVHATSPEVTIKALADLF